MTSYLIAIFVGKDLLDKGGVDFNQMLQRSKKLNSVLEEAGNRYLLFNNDANEQGKAEQVERLMLLVKHVVIKNGGGCFRHKVCRELDTAMENMVKEEIQRRVAATLPMMHKKNVSVAHEDQLAFMMKEPSNKDQVTDLDASDDDEDDIDKLCTQNHSQADIQVLNRQREMDNLKRIGAVRSLTRNFSLPLLPSPAPPPFARRPAPPPPPGPRPVLRNFNLPRSHSASEGLVSRPPQKPTRTLKPRQQSMVSAGLSHGNLLTGLKGYGDSSTFSKPPPPPPPPPPKPSHGNLLASIEVYSDSSTSSKPPRPPPPPPKPIPQGDFGATSSFWTNFSDYVVDVETLLDQIQDELGEDLTRADTADTTFAYQLPHKRHLTLTQKQRLVEDAMKKKILTHPEELNDAQREEMQKAVKSVGQRIRKGMSKFSLMTIDKCQLM
ncbi:protein diaphanous homolog 1-like [Littorina saxatilis]|uniref:protein diaphanous homolog 1-like n=1 Tax=Littorina saxatilis TaxID=31220 RepID=UPI0038B555B3